MNTTLDIHIELSEIKQVTCYRNGRTSEESQRPNNEVNIEESLLSLAKQFNGKTEKTFNEQHEELWKRFEPKDSFRNFGARPLGDPSIEAVTTITNIFTVTLASAGGAAVLLKTAKDILLQWMKNRSQRKIKIKVNNVSIEVQGEVDIDKALKAIEKLHSPPIQEPQLKLATKTKTTKKKNPATRSIDHSKCDTPVN